MVSNDGSEELRASVLEAALDIGVQSPTFTEWMGGSSLSSQSGNNLAGLHAPLATHPSPFTPSPGDLYRPNNNTTPTQIVSQLLNTIFCLFSDGTNFLANRIIKHTFVLDLILGLPLSVRAPLQITLIRHIQTTPSHATRQLPPLTLMTALLPIRILSDRTLNPPCQKTVPP